MNIKVEVDGVQQTIAAFEKVERGIVDLRQLGTWDWVQSELYKVQKEIFASEGSAGKGGKWKGLSSPYKEIKAAKWGDKPILQASGAMYKEFTSDAGNVEKKEQEMTFTFNSPAAFHMGKGGRSKMPYRSSLDLTKEQEERVLAPIAKKLRQLIDNAKLRDIRGF